jgi:hypothetical protein
VTNVTFFDLLDVATPSEAADRWPSDRIQPFLGVLGNSGGSFADLMTYLETTLRFGNLRPGAAGERVGLSAELWITNPPAPARLPLVLTQMPQVGFHLENTGTVPAQIFVTHREAGTEVVVQGLPVRIELPLGFLTPEPIGATTGGELPDVVAGSFLPDLGDSLEIGLSAERPSWLVVHVNVRMTELGDVLLETQVPISIGRCRLSGLPVRGLHDLQIVPCPTPTHVPSEEVDAEVPLEWKRHRLDVGFQDAVTGVITVRTADLAMEQSPWKEIGARLHAAGGDPLEIAIEDLAFPSLPIGPMVPLPSHGRLSLRRQIVSNDLGAEPYDLDGAPISIPLWGSVALKVFRFLVQSTDLAGELPVAFDAVVTTGSDPANAWSFPMTVTEDQVLEFGVVLPGNHHRLFGAFGHDIGVSGATIGFSIPGLMRAADRDRRWEDAFLVLFDVALVKTKEEGVAPKAKTEDASGAGSGTDDAPHYVRDIGWRLGLPAIPSLVPGKDATIKKLRFRIDELGLVGENNGGLYLMVSASLDWSNNKGKPDDKPGTAGGDEAKARGVGLHLHRLRWLLDAGEVDAPSWLLDGASLYLKLGRLEISGFGMIRQYDLTPPGNHYDELAFGVRAAFDAIGRRWDLGLSVYKGEVSGHDNFQYWLMALRLGRLPLGSTELTDLRVLVAENLAPQLAPPEGNSQQMRLFRWYKDSEAAVELPSGRQLTAWAPVDQSLAAGAAAWLSFAGSKAVRMELFFFIHDSPDETGFLAGLELYALKAPKPIAFGAFEWDIERNKWGLTLGFSLGLENVLGDILPSWLSGLGAISGLLFFGNKPDTIAIGQYNDQSTWPSLRFDVKRGLELSVLAALCWHRVDAVDPQDPSAEVINVFAVVVSVKGGKSVSRLGRFKIYATLSVVCGQWRNEAIATGYQIVFEAGVSIRVFGCFNFGASVKVDHAQLGPAERSYHRTSTVIRIETPWYLPDVTFRWESTSDDDPEADAVPVVSLPLTAAGAISAGPRAVVAIGATQVDDPASAQRRPAVHELRKVRELGPAPAPDAAFAAATPVGCDSTIALDFKPALQAVATVLPPAASSAGRQRSGDLSVEYQIVEVGIRRRKRYGSSAGVWTDLVDPLTTRLEALPDLPTGDDLVARFRSAVSFTWDADVQRLGRIDSRRLLVNAATPYSFASAAAEADENIAVSQPNWPCCRPGQWSRSWHVVDFLDTAIGARTPEVERFTSSASTFRWIGLRPPVVVPALLGANLPVARFRVGGTAHQVVATASFDEPAFLCEVRAYWRATSIAGRFVVEAYHGADMVAQQSFPLTANSPALPIRLELAKGMTSLLLRVEPPATTPRLLPLVELENVRYATVRDEYERRVHLARCQAQDEQVHGRGQLAWLPNTDYEITIKSRCEVGYQGHGPQDAEVEQRAFFRTKGLPGLNAVARIGDELEPYVESVYPGPGLPLYRTEPLVVAFGEGLSTLVPIDRAPTPEDPEERHQLVEWALAVDKVGGRAGFERVSATSADWVVAHRPVPLPPSVQHPVVLTASILQSPVRQAATLDPLRVRFENMITRPGACIEPGDGLHTSQVLVHQPVDPAAPAAAIGRWDRGQAYRANLRLKAGPFVERTPFDAGDVGSFTVRSTSGAAAPWIIEDGALRLAPGAPTTVHQYATFGESDWDHVQVRCRVDPQGHVIGVASGVQLTTAPSPLVAEAIDAVIDATAAPTLRLTVKQGTTTVATTSAPLPAGASAPYLLEVTVFDDVVRATVGATTVEVARHGVRQGRLAVVSRGGGRVLGLGVEPLDGYRVTFESSIFDDFPAHVGSFDGTVIAGGPGDGGPVVTTPAALLTATASAIDAAMAGTANDRDALFTRWIRELAIPVRTEVDRLHIGRIVSATATDLFLVEGPEPLPLGRDVTLTVRRRLTAALAARDATAHRLRNAPKIPAWLAALEIDADQAFSSPLPAELAAMRRLVRCESAAGTVLLHVYQRVVGRADAAMFEAVRIETRTVPAGGSTYGLDPGEVGVLDGADQLLIPPFPAPAPALYGNVAVRVLTDGSQRRALVIPVGLSPSSHAPLGAGRYRLGFAIDRPRFRVAAPGAATSYRAARTITIVW